VQPLVYDAPVSVAQPDYTAQCLNARDAKADLFTPAGCRSASGTERLMTDTDAVTS
jgi:hypothetical protein